MASLEAMPQHSVFATVECAGNGRSFLKEKAAGVQWGAGAIGHAEWTGVRLRDLLAPAGVQPGALEVVEQPAELRVGVLDERREEIGVAAAGWVWALPATL